MSLVLTMSYGSNVFFSFHNNGRRVRLDPSLGSKSRIQDPVRENRVLIKWKLELVTIGEQIQCLTNWAISHGHSFLIFIYNSYWILFYSFYCYHDKSSTIIIIDDVVFIKITKNYCSSFCLWHRKFCMAKQARFPKNIATIKTLTFQLTWSYIMMHLLLLKDLAVFLGVWSSSMLYRKPIFGILRLFAEVKLSLYWQNKYIIRLFFLPTHQQPEWSIRKFLPDPNLKLSAQAIF